MCVCILLLDNLPGSSLPRTANLTQQPRMPSPRASRLKAHKSSYCFAYHWRPSHQKRQHACRNVLAPKSCTFAGRAWTFCLAPLVNTPPGFAPYPTTTSLASAARDKEGLTADWGGSCLAFCLVIQAADVRRRDGWRCQKLQEKWTPLSRC